jgi:hypothetical protein
VAGASSGSYLRLFVLRCQEVGIFRDAPSGVCLGAPKSLIERNPQRHEPRSYAVGQPLAEVHPLLSSHEVTFDYYRATLREQSVDD